MVNERVIMEKTEKPRKEKNWLKIIVNFLFDIFLDWK